MMDSQNFLDLSISVGNYVSSEAELVSAGRRWPTTNFSGETEHSPEIFSGAAGILLFLADLGKATGDHKYANLARDGARWVDEVMQARHSGFGPFKGLYSGFSGHGIAMMHVGRSKSNDRLLARAAERADALLESKYGGYELMYGATGIGIFLLRCYQEFSDERYLAEALRAGTYVLEHAEIEGEARKWPIKLGKVESYQMGMAHGAAAIGYFLAELFRFSSDERFRNGALGVARWLQSSAVETVHGAGWPRFPDDDEPPRFQWCHGSPGIGLFFARTYEITGDKLCKEWARRCGDSTYSAGDIRRNPSQCHGLAGNGELLIELARITGDERWQNKAREFGYLAAEYGDGDPPNRRWRSDEPGEYSPDFMLGASGIGHFFLRLARPDQFFMPLMVRPGQP